MFRSWSNLKSSREKVPSSRFDLSMTGMCGTIFFSLTTQLSVSAYLAADTAYGSADTLNWVVNEKKIVPHIPVIDKSKREDGTFSREDFRFDQERNIYICPAGKVLTTTGHIGPDHALRYQASLPD